MFNRPIPVVSRYEIDLSQHFIGNTAYITTYKCKGLKLTSQKWGDLRAFNIALLQAIGICLAGFLYWWLSWKFWFTVIF